MAYMLYIIYGNIPQLRIKVAQEPAFGGWLGQFTDLAWGPGYGQIGPGFVGERVLGVEC